MRRVIIAFIFLITLTGTGFAATSVYYSVGQNTTDHSSGGNVSITSGVATFTVAQTATNLGVGDRLTAGGNAYYLASKVSTTQWNVVTKLGAVPVDLASTAVTSIAHEYASLFDAEAGAPDINHINNTSLVAADVVLNIPCYYDSAADTTTVTVAGWTTDATRYIKIYTPTNTSTECNQSQRHPGYAINSPTYYALRTNSSGVHSMTVNEDYVRIDGLEIKQSSTGASDEVIRIDADNVNLTVTNSLLYFNTRNGEQDIIYTGSAGVTINLENVIGWNAYRAVVDVYNPAGNVTVNINSSSFYNIGYDGANGSRSGCIGIYQTTDTITANMFNTLCHINTGYVVDWYITAGSETMTIDRSITNVPDWDTGVTSVVTDSLLSHNWTDDDTKSSDGDWVIMQDLTTAPYNFLLASNNYNEAQDAHADGSGAGLTMPATDIVGTSRPQNTNYDIGADEYVAAGGASTGAVLNNAVINNAVIQ